MGVKPSAKSKYFMLSTASVSALGCEHDLSHPVIRFWNDTRHLAVEPESADATRSDTAAKGDRKRQAA
jgi:probable phosphoglycerate mutase